jgi:N-formylglutamate amidohydrolase
MMRPVYAEHFEPAFTICEPDAARVPFVVNVPHAGAVYPEPFLESSRLDPLALRRSEDAFVDELFADIPSLGAPLMAARFPRAYLDLNREPYELDSRMFDGRLPNFVNSRSMRVAGGLGTIPRIVADGQEIYRGRLPVEEALHRIDWLYKPYHHALRALVHRTAATFGQAFLIDGHSMPSGSVEREDMRADVVLGDRYGTSCSSVLVDMVEGAFRSLGYKVLRNKPYAGGYITEHYGEPGQGRHALQIEINRSLYMNERTLEKNGDFATLSDDIAQVFGRVMPEIGSRLEPNRMAAE